MFIHFLKNFKIATNISMHSVDSDVLFVDQLSNGPSSQRNNTPIILNSAELWGTHTREMPTISSVAFLEPDFVTLDNDCNEPTIPYRFEAQQPNARPV